MSNLISCQCMECNCEFEFLDFEQVCDFCKHGKHGKPYPKELQF